MDDSLTSYLQNQLQERRHRLEATASVSGADPQVHRLLGEVDAALERMDNGTYGVCEECHDSIETERLIADPLVTLCLDHLTPTQQRALEADLELASKIQSELLPRPNVRFEGWDISYHYEGAGVTSGDYCDVVSAGDAGLYVIVGDVKGKGVAASMLMAHLHATFRALIPLGLPLNRLLERASRAFCESTMPTYFATLVCMKVDGTGRLEIGNAGHPPPLILQDGQITEIHATGLPLGLFCDEQFKVAEVSVNPGGLVLAYTDGVTEAMDSTGEDYGADRLHRLLGKHDDPSPDELLSSCLRDLEKFRGEAPRTDDVTILALKRLEDA